MILHYSRVDKQAKATEVLNDLLKINNDRIAGYQKALDQSVNIEAGLRREFEEIIREGFGYQQQLIQHIRQMNGEVAMGTTIFGKIYRAWTDLKVTFAYSTQKTIVASCLYNEEIALHAYNAAMNMNINMSQEIRQLIEEHEEALKRTHSQMRKYRETRYTFSQGAVYFN